MRLNYWIVYCGGSIITLPPTLSGVEAPAPASIVLSSSAMTFTLDSIPAPITNLKLVIEATERQGNGITRAYSKATAFGNSLTSVDTAIDIKSDCNAKYGTPSASAPKVFFKYFYVNTATGEKPGEVLASAKLA